MGEPKLEVEEGREEGEDLCELEAWCYAAPLSFLLVAA